MAMEITDRKTILVADDELVVRAFMKKTLSKNYTVLEACDGEQAVDIARREKPALILMDIMMPKLDGIGACSVIKSDPDNKAIPVIMVTARWQQPDQEYAREMGADGYIVKPFRPKELLETVSNYLTVEGKS
jgi:CheY-like chemotaxis protein